MGTKTYDRQTGKFLERVAENMPDMSGAVMQGWIDNPLALQKFLAGLNPPQEETVEPSLDFIVRVNRSLPLTYPDWVEKVMHPDLQSLGPVKYDLRSLDLWLSEEQKKGVDKGSRIYDRLKETDGLNDCLGFHDALAIQEKGIEVFRKCFGNKVLPCWKSVVRYRVRNLRVPCVCGGGDRVVVYWSWLEDDWSASGPAPRFASSLVL